MKWSIEVPVDCLPEPKTGEGGYQPLNSRKEILPKGWNGFNSKALLCDILIQHDVPIKVRDGYTLYADVYRPPESDVKVPAIICWSPFGKKFNGITSLKLMTPWNLGIHDGTLSGLEKFEAPDPADWVAHGYAIINVDSRGAFDSEGVMAITGSREAEDGYDVVEHFAVQPWCNGNIGLGGNSHLAIIQWLIAALRPPHLKAIAPWEGCGDLYREQFARGGIYGGDLFDKLIVKYMLKGRHGIESFRQMFENYPLANEWWNDKRPDMSKIQVPTYITGTWTNTMHGMGAIRGWLEVDTPHKWLRWHPWQEWFDLWGNPQANRELLAFFDHFLKEQDNGWEQTARVRMAVLKFGEEAPIENWIVDDFPLPQTRYRRAYLNAGGKLSFDEPQAQVSMVSHDAEDTADFSSFTYTFEQATRIVGIPKAVLYMSCDGKDDMDVFVLLRKLSASGEPMLNLNIPWKGLPVSSIEDIPADKKTEVIL